MFRCVLQEEKTFDLAKVFGAPYIVNSAYIPKSIRETIHKMGKIILLFEGGKSLDLDQSVIDYGVEGALNIMKRLQMQDGEIIVKKDPIIVQKSKWLRAPYSGMFQSQVKNGSKVKRKEILGKIFDPFGEFEKKVIAPFDCYIFGLNTAPIVHKGDAIFHVSIETT